MKIDAFHSLIRRVLKEEVERRSAVGAKMFERVPEVVHDKQYKDMVPHEREERTKEEMLDDLTKVVKGIDKSFTVVWDDFDTISINGRDIFRIRIIPKWENNFSIEAMTRNEDRIYVSNQTWEQVKDFVEANLKSSEPNVDKAWNKSVQNRKDQTPGPDKGLPQKDKPKILPLTNEPSKETKNKEKDYKEDMTKDEKDLPEKPMQEVEDFKKQVDHKSQSPLKLRREKTKFPYKKPNTTLTIPIKKQ